MRVIAKFVIAVTVFSLVLLVLCFAFTRQFSNPQKLDQHLRSANVYELGAQSLRSSIKASLAEANVTSPELDSMLTKSVSAQSVAAAAQPLLQSITEWLQSPVVAEPSFALDMTSIKSQLVRESRLASSVEVGFVVTREVDDSIALNPKPSAESNSGLKGFKERYDQLNAFIGPLLAVTAGGLLLLVVLALRLPPKRLAWPGWVFIISAVIGIALVYVLPTILGATVLQGSGELGKEGSKAILAFIRSTIGSTRPYWYVLAACGAGLLALSVPVGYTYKKKSKGRH